MNEIPQPEVISLDRSITEQYSHLPLASRAFLQPVVLKTDNGVWLPGVLARPAANGGTREKSSATSEPHLHPSTTCLFLAEGFASTLNEEGEVDRRIAKGETVLAIDLRGVGETRPVGDFWYNRRFGGNGGNAMLAYLLDHSLVGMRVEDCLTACRWLREQTGVTTVDVVASGELTVAALHAAALESTLISNVEIRRGLTSWADLVEEPLSMNQFPNVIHAALQAYDLPDLERSLGKRLKITQPHDPQDRPVEVLP